MKHYKKQDGSIWAFESDGSQDHLIEQDMMLLTQAELEAIRNPAPTIDQLIAANVREIQSALDAQAKARGYDSILSACSYAAQPTGAPFQAESAAFVAWRSAVWAQAYAALAQVQAGTVPMPTPAEAVAAMPALSLP
jgi:hypothetical protein